MNNIKQQKHDACVTSDMVKSNHTNSLRETHEFCHYTLVSVVTLYNSIGGKQFCLLVFAQKAKTRHTILGWCLGFVFPHYISQIPVNIDKFIVTRFMCICCLINSWPNSCATCPLSQRGCSRGSKLCLQDVNKTLIEVNGSSFQHTER